MAAFWHLVCGKLCLPSQYARGFADLDTSHAIWLSSDSPAKKSREVLLRLVVERFVSLLPEISFFFFFSICIWYQSTDHSLVYEPVLHENNSVMFWVCWCEREPTDPLACCLPDYSIVQSNRCTGQLFKPALGVEHCCCKGCVCSENGLSINNINMDVVAEQAILNMSLLYSFSGGITTHMTSFLLL